MGFGALFTQGPASGDPHSVLNELIEQAVAADNLGFNAALTTEHKYSEEYFGAPLPLSYAIAAKTERVRVGTSIAIAPLYNPIELAQDAAILDQLSGGRLFLGLGAGYLPEDFHTVGIPFEHRARRFDEAARIVRQAWSEDRFSFDGEIHSFQDISVIPKPRQQPTPLHLGAWTPGGLRRAGRLGDGWISNALMSVDTMRTMGEKYRSTAREHGRSSHVTAVRFCWPAPTREQAERDFGSTAVAMTKTLWRYGAITDMPEIQSESDITLDKLTSDRFIIGTPDDCVQSLRRFTDEAEVDDFLLIFRYPTGPSLSKVLSAMELFQSDVATKVAL